MKGISVAPSMYLTIVDRSPAEAPAAKNGPMYGSLVFETMS